MEKNIRLGKFEILGNDLQIANVLSSSNVDVVFVNFGTNTSVKIVPFFEKIKKKELNNLLEFFKNMKVDLHSHSIIGMLHIVLLKLLLDIAEEQILIVSDTGFNKESIIFLQKNFSNLMENKFKSKSIVIYNENLASDI